MNGAAKHVIGRAVDSMNAELDHLHKERAELADSLARMDAKIEGLCVARDTLLENFDGED